MFSLSFRDFAAAFGVFTASLVLTFVLTERGSAQGYACLEEGRMGWKRLTIESDQCCGFLAAVPLATPTGKNGKCEQEERWDGAFVCARCGDGQCGPGENTCNCKRDCGAKSCGNKRLEGNESCDDGNRRSGDGCSSRCGIEEGWVCRGKPSICITRCGDGFVTPAEQCDDGNVRSGDGCSLSCSVEEGWTCAGNASRCARNGGIPAAGKQGWLYRMDWWR